MVLFFREHSHMSIMQHAAQVAGSAWERYNVYTAFDAFD